MNHRRPIALVLLLATGCATIMPQDTPAQMLGRQRMKDCDRFPSVRVAEVRPDGPLRVTVYGVSGVAELPQWQACMTEAWARQKKQGQVAAEV